MVLELANRDSVGVLIAYLKLGDESFYAMAAVEYWAGTSWFGYVDAEKGAIDEQYFEYLRRFRLDYDDLRSAYHELIELNDEFDLATNKPMLFIDFGTKHFASCFFEQELEERVPEGWTGEDRNVEALIPEAQRYWIQS